MKNFLQNNWLACVAVVMVLGAIASYLGAPLTLPYAYYQLMNWAVTIAAFMIAWQAYKHGKVATTWLFSLVAIFFNPIAPIYLSASAWQAADIIVVVIFLAYFWLMRAKKVSI